MHTAQNVTAAFHLMVEIRVRLHVDRFYFLRCERCFIYSAVHALASEEEKGAAKRESRGRRG